MKIKLRVYPKASRERVIQDKDSFKVYVTIPAEKQKANKRALLILAKFLKIEKSRLSIVKGKRHRDKIIEIS